MKNTKMPAIRFKGFNDDWEQRKFGDLGSVAMCKRVFKEQTMPVGEIPFYKIGTFGAEPDAFISRELFEEYKSNFQYPNVGDMLISASGTIGRTVEYSGEEAYFQDSNIVWFKHDDRIDNSFLRCIYNIVKWNGIEGSTIKRLYNDNFLKTEFYMPTAGEQAKISAYFRSLDHLITLHQRKLEKIKIMKKSMLEKMFPREAESIPKIRFDGYTDDWEQRKLGDISSLITKGTTPKDKSGTGEVNFIKVENINDFSGDIVGMSKISLEEHQEYLKRSQLQEGDILFSIAGTLGRVTSVNKAILPANTNQALSIIRLKKGNLEYVKTCLKGNVVADFIRRNPTIGAQPNLSLEQVSNLEIEIPSEAEQEKIGLYFSNLDHLITLHQRKLEKLKKVKKSLLEHMFPMEK